VTLVDIGSFPLLKAFIPKIFKLVEIAMVQVLGLAEDERTFSTLFFHEIQVEDPPQ
jgi:hypothetical protein